MSRNKIIESLDFNPAMKKNLKSKVQKSSPRNPVISSVARAMDEVRNEVPIHIDPNIVDPSIAQDRFEPDTDTIATLESLVESIKEFGQNQPALVRPHPEKSGRYQLAYGHRRLEAIKTIASESSEPEKWKFIAFVKNLSDEELLLLQTSENSERENLTWIESAMWALNLTENCDIPQKKLALRIGTNESGISRMLSVARNIPHDIIHAIGRASGIGQPRWSSLSNLISDADTVKSVRKKISTSEFKSLNPQDKFNAALQFAQNLQQAAETVPTQKKSANTKAAKTAKKIKVNGRQICEVAVNRSGTQFVIPAKESPFADWLQNNLPKLYDEFGTSSD